MNRIRELRKVSKLTQTKLAAKTGVSRATIARYEAGGNTPTLEIAAKIAKTLGCTIDELVK